MNSRKFSLIVVYICRACALITLVLGTSNCLAATPGNSGVPKSIRVVMDDNYPPYVFKDDRGQLKGITVDQWRIWAQKTGIHVEITGTDWNEAQRRMQAGEFDVIDTIFRNEKREKIYDFTKPYAVIPVPLFFHSDISGISGTGDARGFMVAAKTGGNVLDVLRKNGVTNIVEYPSYEKIIEAARDGKVKVFTVDRPPALYLLNKMGIQNSFRETAPLYSGEFHRAVLKGHTDLLEVVETGFAHIPKADYEVIDKRWLGASIAASPYLRYALYCIGSIAGLVLVLMGWLWLLKRAVSRKTHELAMSGEHHKSILQTAMSGIWLTDRQGHLLEVNKSYCQMSGYSEQELLTMSIADLDAQESGADITDRIRLATERGAARFESRHRRKDGTVIDVEVSVQYQPTNGGQCVAFLQDISERKRAEENIKNSNYLLQTIINTAPMSIFWKDTELRYLGCNDAFAKDAGVEAPEDLIGKDDYQLAWQDQAELYRTDDLRIIASGVPNLSYDEPQTSPEGSLKWLRTSKIPLRNEADEVMGVLGMYEDITKWKLVGETLRKSEAHYRSLFDNSLVGVVVAGRDSLFTDANQAFCQMLEYGKEELIGKMRIVDIIHPDEADKGIETVKMLVENEIDNFSVERRYISKTGKTVTALLYVNGFYDPEGGYQGAIASILDITDRKLAEGEKLALEQQFQQTQKLESLGVLAGGIAHDFNNILAIIIGNCSLAKINSDNAENHIATIEKASERAAALCRQMLAYAGKTQIVQSKFDLRLLVDEIIIMLKSSLPLNAVMKSDYSADILFINGDASQVRQVVMNLIINASEAIGELQGEIRVALTKTAIKAGRPVKDQQGKIIAPGLYACLEVTDNGCGMDNETIQRIFEPFYTTKFTGRGLGMSAVLGIIMSHGGALQLFSQPGQGTAFKVYLPVQISESAGKESIPQDSSALWQGSGTILLAEDEEMVREVAKAMLEELGFTIIAASNGREALELYQKNAADIILVLTDMGMPVMNGYELCRELKKLKPELPIIISSGFGDVDITSKIARDEIAGLIGKPFTFDQLRAVLKSVVDGELLKQA